MQEVLDWLAQLPAAALYLALAVTAAVENIFPPLPADTVVAFGSFLAARGERSIYGAFLSTWGGNIAGAIAMYFVGRRFGATWIRRKFGHSAETADRRLRALYGKYGLIALFLSRFLPGVRALVPPLAGALRIPAVPALSIMAVASGLWYGVITWLAYRVGDSWEELLEAIGSANRWLGIGAAIVVGGGLLVWFLLRRRSRAGQ